MQFFARSSWRSFAGMVSAMLATSCGVSSHPADAGIAGPRSLTDGGTPALLECPTNATLQTQALIGLLGGELDLAGTSVLIPAGALTAPTKIVLTIPASKYMEIDVSVPGLDHFTFAKSIVVTMSYARCQQDLSGTSLEVWHIDSQTKALLERMPSIDEKLTRTVVFTTGHLSGYALAD